MEMIKFLLVLIVSFMCFAFASAEVWDYVSDPSPDPITDMFFINEYTGWAVGGRLAGTSSALRKTTNGGVTWTTPSYPSSIRTQFNGIYFMNGTHGWVVGNDGIILNTTNSGNTWSSLYFPAVRFLDDIYAFNRTLIYTVGWPGVIYKTSNGGSSWTPLTAPTADNYRAVAAPSATTVYVVGGNSVLKSTSAGSSWINQGPLRAGGITLLANDIRCVSTTNCHIAASNGYVCTTTSGGAPWTCGVTQSTVGFSSAFYVNESTGWAVGGAGGPIQFTNDYGATWATETASRALPFFTRAVQMIRARCYTNSGWIGYFVGESDSSIGPSSLFRRGVLPTAPILTTPECPSGSYTEVRDAQYCLTGYSCVEEPSLTSIGERPSSNPSARPRCTPIMNDCQAQFNPVYTYDSNGCAVSYTCEPTQRLRKKAARAGKAFFIGDGAENIVVLIPMVALIVILLGGLWYIRHTTAHLNVSKKKQKEKS